MVNKYNDPIKVIIVSVGENFIISLDSNPTTGYGWQVEFDSNFIGHDKEHGRKFYRTSEEVGSGGKEEFEFKALRSGKTNIMMLYKRSWEAKPIKKTKFNVEIVEK